MLARLCSAVAVVAGCVLALIGLLAIPIAALHMDGARGVQRIARHVPDIEAGTVPTAALRAVWRRTYWLTPDEAFTVLRGYARAHHRHLSDLAHHVVDGTADITALVTTHFSPERDRRSPIERFARG